MAPFPKNHGAWAVDFFWPFPIHRAICVFMPTPMEWVRQALPPPQKKNGNLLLSEPPLDKN